MKKIKDKNFNLRELLLKKHKLGQEKYGAFSFLNDGRDMDLETIDELVDAINYLVYKKITEDHGKEVIKKWSVNTFNHVYDRYLRERINNISPEIKMVNKIIEHLCSN